MVGKQDKTRIVETAEKKPWKASENRRKRVW